MRGGCGCPGRGHAEGAERRGAPFGLVAVLQLLVILYVCGCYARGGCSGGSAGGRSTQGSMMWLLSLSSVGVLASSVSCLWSRCQREICRRLAMVIWMAIRIVWATRPLGRRSLRSPMSVSIALRAPLPPSFFILSSARCRACVLGVYGVDTVVDVLGAAWTVVVTAG